MNDAIEKEIAESMGGKLLDAIALLTKAIRYHADVVGYQGDALNRDDNGKARVTLETTCPAPDNNHAASAPEPEPIPETQVTEEDLKKILSRYSATKGKDAAIALITRHSGGNGFKAIRPDDYAAIVREATA